MTNKQTIRSQKLADALVEGLTNGTPLRELCRTHGVSKSAVYDWIDADKDLAGRIARARARGYEEICESTLEIADDARNDYMQRLADDGDEQAQAALAFNAEHVQRSKLRIETRLKLLAKWDPARYGDKQQVSIDGKLSLESLVTSSLV